MNHTTHYLKVKEMDEMEEICPLILNFNNFQIHAEPLRVPARHQRLAEGSERGRQRHHRQRHDDVVVAVVELNFEIIWRDIQIQIMKDDEEL